MSHSARASDHRLALPAGTPLGEYRVEHVLGAGPFGITYLALDAQNRRVVIKEYLPSDMVVRVGTMLRGETASDDELLRKGRDRFLSEGKRLQRVKHANVVRVHNAFEANKTGYLVLEHESGEVLADVLTGAHALADEPLLRRFAFTLLEALDAAHEAAFLHGKVEPGNILLRGDGTPVLLDFGTARAATGLTRRASMALVPGYAAIEQYTSHEAQGPWTDLYGLAAILYRIVSGKDPLDAPARLLEDRLTPAAQAGSGRFSRTFLRGIDAALVVRPEDRPQTVAEWRPMLDRPLAPKAEEARDPNNADDDDYVPYGTQPERSRTWIYATAGVASFLVLGTLALAGIGYMANNAERSTANNPAAQLSDRAATARDSVLPLPPMEDAATREARLREDERQVAAQIAAARTADEQRARDAARERQAAAAREADEQRRTAQQQQQQEQARQAQARQQEQAKQEQERQAAAARAAEETRQREVARQEQIRQEQARQEAAKQEAAKQEAAKQEAVRQEAARQEQARAEQARAEQVRAEQARQEAARQEQARAEQAKAEQERVAAARAEEAQQRASAQQEAAERQAAATRVAEEIRQREAIRQQEQAAAARSLEEARVREQARAPAEAPRTSTTTGSAMLLAPPPAGPSSSSVPLTLTPPPQAAPGQQVARAMAPPLVQSPASRPEPVVATPAPAARAAVDVGRIDAVNWQWGYVVMQMEQRAAMQVGDRVYARAGDTKLWMTVRRVSGTQVSAVPDSDLQRYSVNGRIYKD